MNLNLPNSAIMDRLIRIKDRLTDRAERDAISDAVNRIYELAMALKTADFSGNGNVMRHAAIALRCPDGFEPLCDGFEASTSESLEGKLDDALKHVAKGAEMSDLRKLLDEATPGPWIERWDEDGGAFVTGNNYVRAHMVGPESDRRANARLIALAPDLAAALLEAEEALDDAIRIAARNEAGPDLDAARDTLTEIRKLTGAK